MKRRKPRVVVSTLPLELGEASHRLRHHGKHHQGELWRATTVVGDVINTTTSPQVTQTAICYTTNEVLIIIGLTCLLNLAFIAVVMSCVHFCSNPNVNEFSRLESKMFVEDTTSDSDLEDLEKNEILNFINISPFNRNYRIEEYLSYPAYPEQVSIPRSSSTLSLHTLVPS